MNDYFGRLLELASLNNCLELDNATLSQPQGLRVLPKDVLSLVLVKYPNGWLAHPHATPKSPDNLLGSHAYSLPHPC